MVLVKAITAPFNQTQSNKFFLSLLRKRFKKFIALPDRKLLK